MWSIILGYQNNDLISGPYVRGHFKRVALYKEEEREHVCMYVTREDTKAAEE